MSHSPPAKIRDNWFALSLADNWHVREQRHPGPPTYMKTILSSKVVWLNFISTLLEISVVLEGLMPAKYLIYTTAAKSILNIILRVWFTSQPILAQPTIEPGKTYRVE
jgi:hypothetical protein